MSARRIRTVGGMDMEEREVPPAPPPRSSPSSQGSVDLRDPNLRLQRRRPKRWFDHVALGFLEDEWETVLL